MKRSDSASLLLKIGAAAALLCVLALAAVTVFLKLYLSPEKIRGLIIANAQKTLEREVLLGGISLGVLKGLSLEGLEVSEKPDFKAGKFAGVESFQLKVELLPLLHGKLVVNRVAVKGLEVSVVKSAAGRFNFHDLMGGGEAPRKQAVVPKSVAKDTAPALPFALKVQRASLSGGRLDYRDEAAGEHVRLSGLEARARDFSVDPTAMRLSATVEKLQADLAGLRLSVSGKVKADKERLEAEDWKGSLGDGALTVAFSVKDYAKAPDLDLRASLSRLDLGQLLAVKEATQIPGQAAAKGPAKPGTAAPSGTAPAMKARGKVTIGEMAYSGAVADNTELSWELHGITPDLRRVAGWAKLHVAGGRFEGENKASGRSGLVKALLIPFTILQQIGRLLSPLRILPDFSHMVFTEIVGDYVFDHGVMAIRDFHMDSAAAKVVTTGTIDLAAQRLNLVVSVNAAQLFPVTVDVGGTFDNPSVKPRLAKTLAAPAKKLTDQAGKLLKSLFGK